MPHKNRAIILQKKKDYYRKNRERLLLQMREYYKENSEKIILRNTQYVQKNTVRTKEWHKQNYALNKDKIEAQKRKYNERNKDIISDRKKIYYENNKKKLLQSQNEYFKKKYHSDINIKILSLLRGRFFNALKGTQKKSGTLKLLGCSIEEFKKHIEAQFKEDMSWDNHTLRGWHFDHIRPCASFDLTDIEEQKKCFHYTNFQPLWWRENIIKGSKIG